MEKWKTKGKLLSLRSLVGYKANFFGNYSNSGQTLFLLYEELISDPLWKKSGGNKELSQSSTLCCRAK